MLRSFTVLLNITILSIFMVGCSITDYPGHRGRNTEEEALIDYNMVPSMTFFGFGENRDGTYMYTTQYKNRHWEHPDYKFTNKIISYRNEVLSSSGSTQGISIDGDAIEGSQGFSGGIYKSHWVAYDRNAKKNGGIRNLDKKTPLDKDGNWIKPYILFDIEEGCGEVDDKDINLQSTIKNAGSLLKYFFFNQNGASEFSVGINSIQLNETRIPINPSFSVGVKRFGMKIENIRINGEDPSFKKMVRSILKKTSHLEPVHLGIVLEGGLEFPIQGVKFSFNHDGLKKWLEQSK